MDDYNYDAPNNFNRRHVQSLIGDEINKIQHKLQMRRGISYSNFTKQSILPQTISRKPSVSQHLAQKPPVLPFNLKPNMKIQKSYQEFLKELQYSNHTQIMENQKKTNIKCYEPIQTKFSRKTSQKIVVRETLPKLSKRWKNLQKNMENMREDQSNFKWKLLNAQNLTYQLKKIQEQQSEFQVVQNFKTSLAKSFEEKCKKQKLVNNQFQQFQKKEQFHQYLSVKERIPMFIKNLFQVFVCIKRLGITLQSLIQDQIFSHKPFQNPLFYDFLIYAKNNNIPKLIKLLTQDPYIVHQYDEYNMTALHWAAKRGNFDICYLLLRWKSDVNAIDIIGRPPLFFALQEGHTKIYQILLMFGANPWSSHTLSYKEILANDPLAKSFIDIFRFVTFQFQQETVKIIIGRQRYMAVRKNFKRFQFIRIIDEQIKQIELLYFQI